MILPERKKMEEKWKALNKQAANKNNSFKEPISMIFFCESLKKRVVPYCDSHLVGDFNGLNNGNVNQI